MMKFDATIKVQRNGSSLFVEVDGAEKQINDTLLTLWQWRAINTDPDASPRFFWVGTKDFMQGIASIFEHRLWNRFGQSKFRKVKGGLMAVARRAAKRFVDSVATTNIAVTNECLESFVIAPATGREYASAED